MHTRRALSAPCARSKNRLPEGFSLPSSAVKISIGASKHSRRLGAAGVHRKTARPFRSIYRRVYDSPPYPPCARERGCNPIRTYTRARTTTREPHTKEFLRSHVTGAETLSCAPARSRSTRRSRNETLRELGTGSERKSS